MCVFTLLYYVAVDIAVVADAAAAHVVLLENYGFIGNRLYSLTPINGSAFSVRAARYGTKLRVSSADHQQSY